MNGGREARAEHRATVERAIGLLDAVREHYDGNSKPLSYSKVQYGDYVAGLALPEAQRGQFYAGMLDYYFTGVEPTHFNRQQQLVFAGIRQRVLNARAQALSKSGADLPKVWNERVPKSDAGSSAKANANLSTANGGAPAISGSAGVDLGADTSEHGGASRGGNAVQPTTNYGLSAIAPKAIADMPSNQQQGASRTADRARGGLFMLGVPISSGLALAPCPRCGEALPIYADGRGNPMVRCERDGYQTIELPEGIELAEVFKGSGTYALRAKNGTERRRNGNG